MKITNLNMSATVYENADPTVRESVEAASRAQVSLNSANLSGADLTGANLRGANLRGADLTGADLPYAPKIAGLEAQILNAVTSGAGTLNMESWHTCETTHCRAGWAIQLAGEAGRVLESVFGPSVAGALIYQASCGYVPDFHASGADALADIRARAAVEVSQ